MQILAWILLVLYVFIFVFNIFEKKNTLGLKFFVLLVSGAVSIQSASVVGLL